MEQLRHRLTNVDLKGQTCRADQNPLKRSDVDELESPAVASHPLRITGYNPKNRHERKGSEHFKSFTYDELTKRDKLNLDIFCPEDESSKTAPTFPIPILSPPRSSKTSKPPSPDSPR